MGVGAGGVTLVSKLHRASTNTQYLTQESKGGLSDTKRPNARAEWNEPPK